MHDRLRNPARAPCLLNCPLQDAALLHLVRNVQRFPEHVLRALSSWARGCACSHVRWRSGAGCTLPRLRVSPSRSACRLSSSAITLIEAAAAQRVFSCCYGSGHRFSDTRCGPMRDPPQARARKTILYREQVAEYGCRSKRCLSLSQNEAVERDRCMLTAHARAEIVPNRRGQKQTCIILRI